MLLNHTGNRVHHTMLFLSDEAAIRSDLILVVVPLVSCGVIRPIHNWNVPWLTHLWHPKVCTFRTLLESRLNLWVQLRFLSVWAINWVEWNFRSWGGIDRHSHLIKLMQGLPAGHVWNALSPEVFGITEYLCHRLHRGLVCLVQFHSHDHSTDSQGNRNQEKKSDSNSRVNLVISVSFLCLGHALFVFGPTSGAGSIAVVGERVSGWNSRVTAVRTWSYTSISTATAATTTTTTARFKLATLIPIVSIHVARVSIRHMVQGCVSYLNHRQYQNQKQSS